jgi:uncharacterized membrane protein
MQKSKQLNLNRVRTFSEAFQDTRQVIRDSFPVLGRGLLYIAGPFYIGVHFFEVFLLYQNPYDEVPDLLEYSDNIAWKLGLTLLLGIIANMMSIGTVAYYFALCREKGMQNVTLGDLAKRVFRRLPALLGTTAFFIFVVGSTTFLIGLFIAGTAVASPLIAGMVVFLCFVGLILVYFPLQYYFYSLYLVRANEKAGLFRAMGRTRQLMRGNYWTTWVLFFCLSLVLYIIGLTFAMPQFVFTQALELFAIETFFSEETKEIITMSFTFLAEFLARYASAFGFVLFAIHYFSLRERHDGEGMNNAINTIGKPYEDEVETTY